MTKVDSVEIFMLATTKNSKLSSGTCTGGKALEGGGNLHSVEILVEVLEGRGPI